MAWLTRQVQRVGRLEPLDGVAEAVAGVARPLTDPTPVKNALSGTWLGHRLHPLLTDVAIGSFLGATVLDVVAPGSRQASRRLIGFGVLASLPTAASGLSDWVDVYDDGRRIGLVHAAGNTLALALYLWSFRRRGRGGRLSGKLLSLLGLGVLAASGYLGGHLAYELGVGVDQAGLQPRIADWVDVAAADDLREGEPMVATAGEVELMLVRQGGRVHALNNRCTHAAWGLAKGELEDGCVTCPGHGSRFALEDGAVVRGPAAAPQPVYQVRESDGRILVRS